MSGEFLNQIRTVSYPESEIVRNLKKHIGEVAGNGKTETSIGMNVDSAFDIDSEFAENVCLRFLKNEGFYCREDSYVSHLFHISW